MLSTKPYAENIDLWDIIIDGWSRGFHPEQTQEEAMQMGLELSQEFIRKAWSQLDQELVIKM